MASFCSVFTKEVVEAMTSFNEKPLILVISNPTSQSEYTAEEDYTWSKGHVIFASGSLFDPVEYNGKLFVWRGKQRLHISWIWVGFDHV